jgi:hypothetical protein
MDAEVKPRLAARAHRPRPRGIGAEERGRGGELSRGGLGGGSLGGLLLPVGPRLRLSADCTVPCSCCVKSSIMNF